jgi:serine/threonine protein kinase
MGELVRDRYEAQAVLGGDSGSEVVHAIDRQHGRPVALKLRRVAPDDPRDRILAEGRALLDLRPHPALPVVRDDFFLDDRYVLVVDWVDGTNVARIVRERGDPGMAVATVLAVLPVIAEALDHLHRHEPRVIHGDVRPENVIVAGDGRATLVFGAGTFGSSVLDENAYRAPELMESGPVGPAADVFGLAATIVYALTGQPPGPGPRSSGRASLPISPSGSTVCCGARSIPTPSGGRRPPTTSSGGSWRRATASCRAES